MKKQVSFTLTGQVALVTASSKGIGRACALALAEAGADVILGLRNLQNGETLVKQIREMGREVLPVQMDVTRLDEITSAIQEGLQYFKHIDILVNNAGIGAPNPAESVTEKDFDDTLNVNLKGTFFTAQAVGRVMIRQKHGRIINICSQAGFVALPTESVYCMTKAAIAHLTKCLALEWAPYHSQSMQLLQPSSKRLEQGSGWTILISATLSASEFHSGVSVKRRKWQARSCFWPHRQPRSSLVKRSWWTAAGRFNRMILFETKVSHPLFVFGGKMTPIPAFPHSAITNGGTERYVSRRLGRGHSSNA